MEKKDENLPGKFYQRVPIMYGMYSYLARSMYYLTTKKPRMYAFLRSPDFGGLAARLLLLILLLKKSQKKNDFIYLIKIVDLSW